MNHTKFLLRILKAIGDNIVEGWLNNVLRETGTNPLDLDEFCREYIEFWYIRESDMENLAHELKMRNHKFKFMLYDYTDTPTLKIASLLKHEDRFGLLSDSFDEIDLKLSLRGL